MRDYTGPREITTPNTVISGVRFTQGSKIIISAPGVQISNSEFNTQDYYDVSMNDNVPNASVVITDSSFVGDPTGTDEEAAIRGSNWTLRRVEISGYTDGGFIDGNNTVTDSYVHNFHTGNCIHADGFQGLGTSTDVLIQHNTIDMSLTSCMAGLVQLGNEFGPNSNDTVDNNWLAGGSYMFYASMAPTDYPTHDIRFTNNHLSSKYFPTYGAYGVVNYWKPETPGAVWSGNVDATTGAVVNP